jgi:hypothetical protein
MGALVDRIFRFTGGKGGWEDILWNSQRMSFKDFVSQKGLLLKNLP